MRRNLRFVLLPALLIVCAAWVMLSLSCEEKKQPEEKLEVEKEQEDETDEGETLVELNDDNFEDEILKSGKPCLVDFWSEGCPPCYTIAPIIEEIAEEFKGKIKVGKFNVRTSRSIPSKYRIQYIPTIIIFKHGEIVEQFIGLRSKKEISDAVRKALEAD